MLFDEMFIFNSKSHSVTMASLACLSYVRSPTEQCHP